MRVFTNELNSPIGTNSVLFSELSDSRLSGFGVNIAYADLCSQADQPPSKLQPESLGPACDDCSAVFGIEIEFRHCCVGIASDSEYLNMYDSTHLISVAY